MFNFIIDNLQLIGIIAVGVLGFVAIGANIQEFQEQRQRQQRRSESARKGWATRRARAQ